jgi:hypothetical protein
MEYYTEQNILDYMAAYKVTDRKARAIMRSNGTRPEPKPVVTRSEQYTLEQAVAVAQERNISLASAKSYLRKKNPPKFIRKSVYYTEEELLAHMADTGRSRDRSVNALRHRALNPDAKSRTPVIKQITPPELVTEEAITVYMYVSGLQREAAMYSLCREQIIPSDYPVSNWMLIKNKWTLITP